MQSPTPRSFYMLAIGAELPEFKLFYRFLYRDVSHIIESVEWFFLPGRNPHGTLFTEIAVQSEFRGLIWVVIDGVATEAIDVRDYLAIKKGRKKATPYTEAGELLEELGAEGIRKAKLVLDGDALAAALPELTGELIPSGERSFLSPDPSLDEELVNFLQQMLDIDERADWPNRGVVTFGPIDLETGLRIEGFDDPDPAPKGSPGAPLSEDELRERLTAAIGAGDAELAEAILRLLEQGLSYPLYELRAEIDAARGAYESAVTNALFQLTPAPTEEQQELLQRMIALWSDWPDSSPERLMDTIEESLSKVDVLELFDLPETMAAALRGIFDEKLAARLDLLESVNAMGDLSRLEELLDKEAQCDEEKPAVAAGLYLYGLALFREGLERESLKYFLRATELVGESSLILDVGLQLVEHNPNDPKGVAMVKRGVEIVQAKNGVHDPVDVLINRYAQLLDLERGGEAKGLEQALESLEKAGEFESALLLSDYLVEIEHPLGFFAKGRLLSRLGQHEEAIGACRQALRDWQQRARRRERIDVKGHRAACSFLLACSHAALGREEAALEDLKRACRLDETYQRLARESAAFQPYWQKPSFMVIAGGAGAVPQSTVEVGAKIAHKKFGSGSVTAVEGEGDQAKLSIEFDDGTEKKLLARFVKIL